MTCACSRHAQNLKKKRSNVSLHCKENGNYEELQCDNNLCWCVDSMTGKPTQRAYPESTMIYLPCYSKKSVGSQYLQRCESKSLARSKIIEKMKNHGHKYFYTDNVFCDYDGSYGSYQIDHNKARCTWRDGKQIENYGAETDNIFKMNCNCARDLQIQVEANIEFFLICQSNGNYKPRQNVNGYPFCVDSDGFATTDLGVIGQNLFCQE